MPRDVSQPLHSCSWKDVTGWNTAIAEQGRTKHWRSATGLLVTGLFVFVSLELRCFMLRRENLTCLFFLGFQRGNAMPWAWALQPRCELELPAPVQVPLAYLCGPWFVPKICFDRQPSDDCQKSHVNGRRVSRPYSCWSRERQTVCTFNSHATCAELFLSPVSVRECVRSSVNFHGSSPLLSCWLVHI